MLARLQQGCLCHGDALAKLGRELVGDRDLRVQQAARAAAASGRAPGQKRKPRSDRGIRRGPRKPRGPAQHRISELSYARYRLGGERQVNEVTRAAVAEAAARGVAPWNEHTAEPASGGAECEACEADLCDGDGEAGTSGGAGANGGSSDEEETAEWTLDEGSFDLGTVLDGTAVGEVGHDDEAQQGAADGNDGGEAAAGAEGGGDAPSLLARGRRRQNNLKRRGLRRQLGDEIAAAAGDAPLTADGGGGGGGDDGGGVGRD